MGDDSPWRDKQNLYDLYWREKMTAAEMGEEWGVAEWTVLNWMQKLGVPRRSRSDYASMWPATFYQDNGYEIVQSYYKGDRDQVGVHRLAAVAWHGWDEVVDKEVHHRNEIRWDNREENVVPKTPSEHISDHNESREPARDEQGRFAEGGDSRGRV